MSPAKTRAPRSGPVSGAIYDPVAGTWTSVSPPSGSGWTNTDACGTKSANGGVGDAASIVLPDGVFMLGACCASPSVEALFNATTLTYSATGAPPTYQDEQGYTLLPTGNVLTIERLGSQRHALVQPRHRHVDRRRPDAGVACRSDYVRQLRNWTCNHAA